MFRAFKRWLNDWYEAFQSAVNTVDLDFGHGMDCSCRQCRDRRRLR